VAELAVGWKKTGFDLDFGIGIAHGYATLGAIGFEGRVDYGAIGTVTNLSARLCAEAKPGQVLLTQRVLTAVEALVEAEPVGEMSFKGISRPMKVFNLLSLKG
jgi:class 3 adenylate cyclase